MEEQLKKLQSEAEEEEESEVSLLPRRPRHADRRSEVPPPHPSDDDGSNDSREAVKDTGGRNEALNVDKDDDGVGIKGFSSDTDFKSSEETGFSNSVYFDKYQDTESKDSAFEVQTDILNGLSTENNHERDKGGVNAKTLDLGSSLVNETHENNKNGFNHLDNEGEANPDVDSAEEIDENTIDYHVEKVIEKQNTHDLYCPNCNSCITQRVILVRRKRKTRTVWKKPKPAVDPGHLEVQQLNEALTDAVDDQSSSLPNVDSPRGVPTPAPDGVRPDVDVHEGSAADSRPEPEVFRCLSCFSLFIPTGNCFGLFPFSKRDKHKDADQNPQQVATSREAPGTSKVDKINSSHSPKAMQSHLTTDEPDKVQKTDLNPGKATKHHLGGSESMNPPREEECTTRGTANKEQLVEQQNNAITESENPEEEIVCSPTDGSMRNKMEGHLESNMGAAAVGYLVPDTAGHLITTGTNFSAETGHASTEPGTANPGTANQSHKIGEPGAGFPVLPVLFIGKLKSESGKLEESLLKKETGLGSNVPIDGAPVEEDSSQTPVRTTSWAERESRIQIDDNEARDTSSPISHDWEVLKSIVYGGLLELITSLGVVSSAAGAGAATLNILVLGLANLVGGFSVLLQNLIELKSDYSGEDSSQTSTRENRYQRLLGQRDNFRLHATVAILSYIVFGLVPPTVYGFSFRKSDDREYKLVAVAGASLLCIFLLALGKGHVTRPHRTYVKSVLAYLSMGIAASGLSYVAGVLLQRLLTKLGLFESSVAASVQVFESRPAELPWASY